MITSKKAPGYVEIASSNPDGSLNVQVKNNAYMDNTLFFNMTIANGEEKEIVVPTAGFSKVIVMAYGEAAGDVYSTPSPDGSFFLVNSKETVFSLAAGESKGEEVTTVAPSLKVAVKNTSASPANYHLWLYGV